MNNIITILGAKRTGEGRYLARCPAHDDQTPSLSITETTDRVLLKCFAGCSTDSILSAIGLTVSDLFTEPRSVYNGLQAYGKTAAIAGQGLAVKNGLQAKQTESIPAKSSSPRRIVAIYDYCDADGKLIYQNVRYEPKGFTQRRPDGNDGYIYNLQGIDRVPYHLPELIEAQGLRLPVSLTEGEKDADALRMLTLPASSFKHWQPSFNEHIKGQHVVLWQDNDSSGLKQAEAAAKIIAQDAGRVKIINLYDGQPEQGQDISDWIDARRSEGIDDETIKESLADIAEAAEFWTETDTLQNAEGFTSSLILRKANEWIMDAKDRPIPKKLFDEFWFEGETAILFADTGKGKSSLSVQIGESIASGRPISGFEMTARPQKVLYFDFELSDKQFETRYSEKPLTGEFHVNHFRFSDNFLRGEINTDAKMPVRFQTFEEYLSFSLEYHLAETQAKIVIIDNLTYLRQETERSKDALPLMKELKRLKSQYGLSILALAHTPKRDLTRPIIINDLAGSKMLSNFADSVFAVGESAKDNDIRYLKQIKTRSAETRYHQDNICVCQIEKPSNFLGLSFIDYGNEREHLRKLSDNDKAALIQQAKDLQAEGKTQRQIADALSVSLGAVNKYLRS